MRGRAAGFAAAMLLACLRPRTQIVVLIDTDMEQGPDATLTHVRVTVRSLATGLVRQRATYALRTRAEGPWFELPGTLGVTALDNDGARSVEVSVDAVHDAAGDGTTATAMFTSTTIAPFEDQETRLLRVFLADRCRTLAARCDEASTCTAEGCAPRRLASLPVFPPDLGLDASGSDGPRMRPDATAPADAAAPDRPAVDVPRDTQQDLPRDAPQDTPQDVLRDAPQDIPQDVPHDVPQDLFDASMSAPDVAPDVAPDRASPCAADLTRCGSACVDVRTSLSHCGRCNNACPDAPHAAPRCVDGACALACLDDRIDCDGDPRNGCEMRLGMRCGDREPCAERITVCVAGDALCRRVPFACGTSCRRDAVCNTQGECVEGARARCDASVDVPDASSRED